MNCYCNEASSSSPRGKTGARGRPRADFSARPVRVETLLYARRSRDRRASSPDPGDATRSIVMEEDYASPSSVWPRGVGRTCRGATRGPRGWPPAPRVNTCPAGRSSFVAHAHRRQKGSPCASDAAETETTRLVFGPSGPHQTLAPPRCPPGRSFESSDTAAAAVV